MSKSKTTRFIVILLLVVHLVSSASSNVIKPSDKPSAPLSGPLSKEGDPSLPFAESPPESSPIAASSQGNASDTSGAQANKTQTDDAAAADSQAASQAQGEEQAEPDEFYKEADSKEANLNEADQKEVEAPDASPKEANPKEAEPKEKESTIEKEQKESESKEEAPKEGASKEKEPKESELKEEAPKEAESKKAEPQQAEQKQADPNQSETKGADLKETAPKEPSPSLSNPSEPNQSQTSSETSPNEPSPNEPTSNEPNANEANQNESNPNETNPNEPSQNESNQNEPNPNQPNQNGPSQNEPNQKESNPNEAGSSGANPTEADLVEGDPEEGIPAETDQGQPEPKEAADPNKAGSTVTDEKKTSDAKEANGISAAEIQHLEEEQQQQASFNLNASSCASVADENTIKQVIESILSTLAHEDCRQVSSANLRFKPASNKQIAGYVMEVSSLPFETSAFTEARTTSVSCVPSMSDPKDVKTDKEAGNATKLRLKLEQELDDRFLESKWRFHKRLSHNDLPSDVFKSLSTLKGHQGHQHNRWPVGSSGNKCQPFEVESGDYYLELLVPKTSSIYEVDLGALGGARSSTNEAKHGSGVSGVRLVEFNMDQLYLDHGLSRSPRVDYHTSGYPTVSNQYLRREQTTQILHANNNHFRRNHWQLDLYANWLKHEYRNQLRRLVRGGHLRDQLNLCFQN